MHVKAALNSPHPFLCFCGLLFCLAVPAAADVLFADFEGTNYGAWKVEGVAFGSGPASEALPDQKPITGFVGHGFANSKHGGDKATGRLVSPEFTLKTKFITFLVGGGGWSNLTCLNLVADGAVLRTATGRHTKSGGSGEMVPAAWDVTELLGKTAHLEIIDKATGTWGHITVDQIVFTDNLPPTKQLAKGLPKTERPTQAPAAAPSPAKSGPGELLYNGIQLPKEWPPRIQQVGTKILPVPYLTNRPAVVPIDVGRQLFVDDFLIEETTLKREFHYPQRYEGNPILKPQTPTELGQFGEKEADGNLKPMTVMISDGFCYDAKDKLFKLWYQAGWRDGTMIATSQDGLHWTRPPTDIEPGNNRVLPKRPKPVRHGTGISFDPFTTDAAQRYKMLIYEDKKTFAYTSPDGVHWKLGGQVSECGDNATAFYNPFRQKWVMSIRVQRTSRNGRARNYREHADFLQAISWSPLPDKAADLLATQSEEYEWASTDPLDLPDPEMIAKIPKDSNKEETRRLYGDPPQLYNLDAVAYESIMVGMFGILRGPTAGKLWDKLKCVKRNDLHLAYSRDGFYWDRPDRSPFLACTRKEGDWENGYLHAGVGLFAIVNDQLWFYYSGWSGAGPKGPTTYAGGSTGVAFLRRDGFASLNAGEKPGTLLTRPVTFKGKYLFVNADAPQGELKVEVLDEQNRPLAPFTAANCATFSGDKTRQQITWKGAEDLSAVSGKPVRFKFTLTQGRLYAFWVTPDSNGASHGYLGAGGPGFSGLIDQ